MLHNITASFPHEFPKIHLLPWYVFFSKGALYFRERGIFFTLSTTLVCEKFLLPCEQEEKQRQRRILAKDKISDKRRNERKKNTFPRCLHGRAVFLAQQTPKRSSPPFSKDSRFSSSSYSQKLLLLLLSLLCTSGGSLSPSLSPLVLPAQMEGGEKEEERDLMTRSYFPSPPFSSPEP